MRDSQPRSRQEGSVLGPLLSTLASIYNKTLLILNYVSVVCIFIVSLWIFSDVVGRYFFNHPIPGTTEIVKCMIIIIVFLGIAYTFQKERHIRTVLILDRLRPAQKKCVEIIACLIGVAVFSLLCMTSIEAALDSIAAGEYDGVQVRVPVYPSRLTVALGSGLLVIQAILNLFKHFASVGHLKKKEEL